MSTPPNQVFGQQAPQTTDDEFNTLMFVIQLALQKVQTATLVRVLACTNDGGLSPVGTVTVQPLVNQMTGQRQAVPHGPIYNIPYLRIQGGTNAVIMDPVPASDSYAGDIGLMVCASRDISTVTATKAQANPGSLRAFDWSDGLYVGGYLNGTPTQYVQFTPEGINVVSPTAVSVQAPTITLEAATEINIEAPTVTITAAVAVNIGAPDIVVTGEIEIAGGISQTGGTGNNASFSGNVEAPDGDVTAGSVSLTNHEHPPGTYEAGSTPVTGSSGKGVG